MRPTFHRKRKALPPAPFAPLAAAPHPEMLHPPQVAAHPPQRASNKNVRGSGRGTQAMVPPPPNRQAPSSPKHPLKGSHPPRSPAPPAPKRLRSRPASGQTRRLPHTAPIVSSNPSHPASHNKLLPVFARRYHHAPNRAHFHPLREDTMLYAQLSRHSHAYCVFCRVPNKKEKTAGAV